MRQRQGGDGLSACLEHLGHVNRLVFPGPSTIKNKRVSCEHLFGKSREATVDKEDLPSHQLLITCDHNVGEDENIDKPTAYKYYRLLPPTGGINAVEKSAANQDETTDHNPLCLKSIFRSLQHPFLPYLAMRKTWNPATWLRSLKLPTKSYENETESSG